MNRATPSLKQAYIREFRTCLFLLKSSAVESTVADRGLLKLVQHMSKSSDSKITVFNTQ